MTDMTRPLDGAGVSSREGKRCGRAGPALERPEHLIQPRSRPGFILDGHDVRENPAIPPGASICSAGLPSAKPEGRAPLSYYTVTRFSLVPEFDGVTPTAFQNP